MSRCGPFRKRWGPRTTSRRRLAELEKKIKRKRLSKEAHTKVWQEFKKLKMMSPMSAEATVVRNYIDWILALPWDERTKDKMDIDGSGEDPGRRSLRPEKTEGEDPGVPGRAGPHQEDQGADPLPGGSSGRR